MKERDSVIADCNTVGMVDLQRTLEELDPKDKYIGTDLEGLDALDRQLRRLCISSEEMHNEILPG